MTRPPVGSRTVVPLGAAPDAVVRVPGSKSITNRALLCAALAEGRSELAGVLDADDSDAMVSCIMQLGGAVERDRGRETATVEGVAGRWPAAGGSLDARLSGTTSRFVLPALALGSGRYRLDGRAPLRRRPLGDLIGVLRSWGVGVVEEGEAGHLPVTVTAEGHLPGGTLTIPADRTSQFITALLLTGPHGRRGLRLGLTGAVASRPYLDLTLGVMTDFGARAAWADDRTIAVEPGGYRGRRYRIEPDASSASYFLAAAAITGGRITVEGLGTASRQGDARFVDILERMGATADRRVDRTTVTGGGRLQGIDVDLRDQPDMAQTAAVVAAFAEGPTTVRGVEIIRGHETDRIAAVVTELRRCGIGAEEHADGFTVHPGAPRPATVETYDDHRMAMSFALLGLRAPGIAIAEPGCVAKTFPGFWEVLESLAAGGNARPGGGPVEIVNAGPADE
jgi:3-phosphoshikimate 1-carboxyvinyltransferase